MFLLFMKMIGCTSILQGTIVRASLACICSLLTTLFLFPFFIRLMKKCATQPIREYAPNTHLLKYGTPTMGGILIMITIFIYSLIFLRLNSPYALLCLGMTFFGSLIGMMDDLYKVIKKNHQGLPAKIRFVLMFFAAAIFIYIMNNLYVDHRSCNVYIPFAKHICITLGAYLYILWGSLVIVGSSNGVNLTDGLDGLATLPVILTAGCFAFIAYATGHSEFASYLKIVYIHGSSELVIILAALIGSCLGFLWYNCPPAQIFMGDTGSLGLGTLIGAVSIIVQHELVLAISGIIFVLETLSVIIQVISFKMRKKRIFLMSPIHHHLEKKGWAEQTILIRFLIISFIASLLALISVIY